MKKLISCINYYKKHQHITMLSFMLTCTSKYLDVEDLTNLRSACKYHSECIKVSDLKNAYKNSVFAYLNQLHEDMQTKAAENLNLNTLVSGRDKYISLLVQTWTNPISKQYVELYVVTCACEICDAFNSVYSNLSMWTVFINMPLHLSFYTSIMMTLYH